MSQVFKEKFFKVHKLNKLFSIKPLALFSQFLPSWIWSLDNVFSRLSPPPKKSVLSQKENLTIENEHKNTARNFKFWDSNLCKHVITTAKYTSFLAMPFLILCLRYTRVSFFLSRCFNIHIISVPDRTLVRIHFWSLPYYLCPDFVQVCLLLAHKVDRTVWKVGTKGSV